jgi:isopenicillin-N N-acyltransferase-like protein
VSVAVIRCAGDPRDRGTAVGRAFAQPIGRSLDFYRRFLARRGVRGEDLPGLLEPYRQAAAGAFPDLVAELDGLARGAGAPWWELFAVNAWEELEPSLAVASPAERCTAFAVTGPGGTLLAHNELWYAGDRGNVGVVVAEPDAGPAFASPTVVTCLPAVGMNTAGVGQAIMSLTAEDDGVGIPRVFVSRHSLQAAGRDDAIRRATVPGRAGGYAHLFALANRGGFTVETGAAGHAVLEVAAHTNHSLDPALATGGHSSAGSRARLDRLEALLEDRRPGTPEEAMAVLADHGGAPQSICLHPEDAVCDEASATVFAFVAHLEDRRMWVSPGNPCEAPFEEIDVGEVA